MGNVDYRKIWAMKRQKEAELKRICPGIDNESGIYILTRIQPKGYIGKSVNLTDRMVSHLLGYEQPIDLSLKKRKWYSENNKLGYKIEIKHYTKEELDQKEREFIQKYLDAGYELYNVESGGTLGKTMINERKASRSYRDGVEQGRKNIINEILPIVEKYLHITTQKDNKLSIRMLEKFYNILGVKECQKAELSGLEKTQTKK